MSLRSREKRKKKSAGGENDSEMENWLAQATVKPAAHPNADAQQSADRQSKTMAPSPVSWAAWRGAIDNTSACKVQSVPRGHAAMSS